MKIDKVKLKKTILSGFISLLEQIISMIYVVCSVFCFMAGILCMIELNAPQ